MFREAEAMQAEWQPEYPRLYSVQGYQYCDLLLGQAEPDDGFLLVGQAAPASGVGQAAPAARLAAPTAPVGRHSLPYEDKLRLSYRKACTDVRDRAIQALDWMENVFTNMGIPAASDLREAEDIAVRGHMRLHEADVHLEWTRLRLQTGDHEDARRHFGRARELVTAIGYGRREREITSLEASANAVSK